MVRTICIGYRRSRGERSGFTLIELLVVLSILAIVIGVIASAVSAGIVVWDTARNFDARRIEALIWVETLEMELRSAFFFHEIPMECDESAISFPGLVRDETIGEKGTICEIKYWFDRDEGYVRRRARSFPFDVRSTDENAMIMVSNVKDMTLHGVFVADEGQQGSDDGRLKSVRVELKLGQRQESVEICRTIDLPVEPEKDSESAETEPSN